MDFIISRSKFPSKLIFEIMNDQPQLYLTSIENNVAIYNFNFKLPAKTNLNF